MLSHKPIQDFAAHVASQGHAMAGASIAASAALACSLGEACVRISASHLDERESCAQAEQVAERLAALRGQLLALSDEDGAAITTFAIFRDSGQELLGQGRLCEMPVEMGLAASGAARLLQDFRPLVRHVQDDLEMAITLLAGAVRASTLLLDSNLRIWPEPSLLAKYEPALSQLRLELVYLHPAERAR